MYYVYEHWRPDTNICFYVGKGGKKRAYDFKSNRNTHYKRIIAKVLCQGLFIKVKLFKVGFDETASFKLEVKRIAMWRRRGIVLANATDGGEGTSGFYPNAKTREKLSLSHKGKKFSAEHRAKISLAQKNRPPISDETREKIRIAQRKRYLNPMPPSVCEKISEASKRFWADPKKRARIIKSQRGKKLSTEHKAKISKAKLGKRMSDETRAKLRMVCLGRKITKKTRAKMSAAHMRLGTRPPNRAINQ